jgi:hypothetical protein
VSPVIPGRLEEPNPESRDRQINPSLSLCRNGLLCSQ